MTKPPRSREARSSEACPSSACSAEGRPLSARSSEDRPLSARSPSARSLKARSLKARALGWLAQREQSEVEMRRKLLPHARAEDAAAEAAGLPPDAVPAAERVEAVLQWLGAHEYLSQARFAESRVHARSGRFGNLRIEQELKQHAVTLTPDARAALRETELDRARSVRARKFPAWPEDAAERGRQARFLAGRGFSPEVIRQAMRTPKP